MQHTETARACFAENIRLFGNAKTQPEKFNLYNGLLNLADAIKKLEDRLDDIEKAMKPGRK